MPIRQHGAHVPDQFYHATNRGLAHLIVNAWGNPGHLLERDSNGNPTRRAFEEASKQVNALGGFHSPLQLAVVISEAEYNNGYNLQQNERVFVLPNDPGISGRHLNRAEVLMRHTPNGI